jgi:hypothetical protein
LPLRPEVASGMASWSLEPPSRLYLAFYLLLGSHVLCFTKSGKIVSIIALAWRLSSVVLV